MISTKNIYQFFINVRYRQFYKGANGIDVLVQFNSGRRKAVVIVDTFESGITTRKQIKECKNQLNSILHAASVNSVLYLFIGTKISVVNECNTFSICQETAQYSKGYAISMAYRQEIRFLKNLCGSQSALYKSLHIGERSTDTHVIYILIILNIYLFAKSFTGIDPIYIDSTTLQRQQYGHLLMYMFFHANLHHLVGNMFMLWYLGRQLLIRNGTTLFLLTYLGGGIGAGIYSVLYKQALNIGAGTIGASGAIFAILGTLVATAFFDKWSGLSKWAMIKYSLIVLIGSAGIFTDNACHIGGFICGFSIGAVYCTWHTINRVCKSREYRKRETSCQKNDIWDV